MLLDGRVHEFYLDLCGAHYAVFEVVVFPFRHLDVCCCPPQHSRCNHRNGDVYHFQECHHIAAGHQYWCKFGEGDVCIHVDGCGIQYSWICDPFVFDLLLC